MVALYANCSPFLILPIQPELCTLFSDKSVCISDFSSSTLLKKEIHLLLEGSFSTLGMSFPFCNEILLSDSASIQTLQSKFKLEIRNKQYGLKQTYAALIDTSLCNAGQHMWLFGHSAPHTSRNNSTQEGGISRFAFTNVLPLF